MSAARRTIAEPAAHATATNASQTTAKTETRSMGGTVQTPERRRHYRRPSRLAVDAARELGVRPGTVEQAIHGHDPVHLRFAAIVRAAVRLNDRNILAKLMRPVEEALGNLPAVEYSADLVLAYVRADAREDLARDAALVDGMTDAEAEAWDQRLGDVLARAGELRRALRERRA